MRVGTRRAAAVAVLGFLVLAGCTSGSDEPVPTTAEAPFACDGVPQEGARLISGESEVVRLSSSGVWGDLHDAVACTLETADGSGLLTVTQEPLEWHGAATAAEYIEGVAEADGAQEIDADADGNGYAYPEGEDTVTAQWACGDHRLMVSVYRLAGGDRDPLVDVSNYLTSMLPWACGEQDAPSRTVEG